MMLSHPLLVKILFRGVNGTCLDVCRGWPEDLCHSIDPNGPIQEETKVWGDVGLSHACFCSSTTARPSAKLLLDVGHLLNECDLCGNVISFYS